VPEKEEAATHDPPRTAAGSSEVKVGSLPA
jgi:hypothetical protein